MSKNCCVIVSICICVFIVIRNIFSVLVRIARYSSRQVTMGTHFFASRMEFG